VRQFVDNAARAAALSTGTKVAIDNYGNLRDGISLATLAEPAFFYLKKYGGTNVQAEPGKPAGFEETGTVSSAIPGLSLSAQTSGYANHTYEMEQDALGEIGHRGFVVDAESMAALLSDFATHPEYRDAVKNEFSGIQALFGEYQEALKKVYPSPNVPDAKN
jgi:hypothetical protein